MEIGRFMNVERISGKLPSDQPKANAKGRKRDEPSGEEGVLTEKRPEEKPNVYNAPINFEYLPSGKIQLNREARQQVIDFFE